MSDSTRWAEPAARVKDATVDCRLRKEPLNMFLRIASVA